MTPSRALALAGLMVIAGVGVASFVQLPWHHAVPGLLGVAGLLLLVWAGTRSWDWFVAALALAAFLLGAYVYIQAADAPDFNLQQDSVAVSGVVISEPDLLLEKQRFTVEIDSFRVLVTTDRFPEYAHGDMVRLEGVMQQPTTFDGFDYRGYLAKDGVQAVSYYPAVELLQSDTQPVVTTLRRSMKSAIEEYFAPPVDQLLSAILLGYKGEMSSSLKEQLSFAGLRHVTAISGMHITIVGVIVLEVLLVIGLWRHHALWLSLLFVVLFVVLVGAPPSAVRAGIMGVLIVVAASMGRLATSSRTIIFAAAAMLLFNPLLLRHDIGFQLSFLATLGIVHVAPLLQEWLDFVPNVGMRLRSILSMTLAAQLFTIPIVLYHFGFIPLLGVVTNILVVPILPLVMVLGLLFLATSFIGGIVSWIIAMPLRMIVGYLVWVVHIFSRIPVTVLWANISWIGVAIGYVALALGVWSIKKRQRAKLLP